MDLGEDCCEGPYLFHFNVIPKSVSPWSSCHSALRREGARPVNRQGSELQWEREGAASSVGPSLIQPCSVPAPGLTAGDTKTATVLEELPVQREGLNNAVLNNTKSVQNKASKAAAAGPW